MADYALIDQDIASFSPSFGAATVVVRPGTLTGSGPGTVGGKGLCVEGDEGSVEVSGCMYTTPQYSIPGVGTLKIDALAGDQVAGTSCTGGKAVLVVGSSFTAKFEIQSPAQQPPPGPGSPIPDATLSYTGSGSFITSNTKLQVS